MKMNSGGMGAGAVPGMSIELTIKNTDPDGTRHGSLKLDMPHAPGNAVQPLDVTMSPGGAIVTTIDPAHLSPHIGMSKAEQAAVSANAQSAMLQLQLRSFNEFANACGAQASLTVGKSWHQTGAQPPPTDITYTVTGRQQYAGRDTVAVSMQTAPGAAMPVTGHGFYDPAAHVVAGFHFEMKSPDGRQSETVDIDLRPGA
jgi:hypothetical protein